MALNLDTRQRAMLQEMGLTVWSPAPAAAMPVPSARAAIAPAQPVALAAVPAPAPVARAATAPSPIHPAPAAPPAVAVAAAPAAEAAPPASPAAATTPDAGAAAATWQMAPAVALYTDAPGTSAAPADDAWLILWECRNPAQPLEGDSGQLLNNMLRALRLQHHRQVWLAGVQRSDAQSLDSLGNSAHAALDWQPLDSSLRSQLQQLRPARVLLLGLPAARAVLHSQEALGRLRAQVHDVQGVPAVVSYDPGYLLRSAHAKPAAWADLCRAHSLQAPARH